MSRTLRCFVRPSPSRSSVPPLCHDPVDLVQQFSWEWVVGHVGCHREFRAQRVQFNHPTPRAGRSFGPNSSGQGQGAGDSRHIDRRQRTPVPEKKKKKKKKPSPSLFHQSQQQTLSLYPGPETLTCSNYRQIQLSPNIIISSLVFSPPSF